MKAFFEKLLTVPGAMLIAALLLIAFFTFSAVCDRWLHFQSIDGRWGVGWESSQSGGWGITEQVESTGRNEPLPLRKGLQGFCFLTAVGVVPTIVDKNAGASVGLDKAAGTWYLYTTGGVYAAARCATFTPKKRA